MTDKVLNKQEILQEVFSALSVQQTLKGEFMKS